MDDTSSTPQAGDSLADTIRSDHPAVEGDEYVTDRDLELIEKGKLFEQLEALEPGSEIAVEISNGKKQVRIKVKGVGLHATYLHGDSIAGALATPEQT